MKTRNVIISYVGLFLFVATMSACADSPRQQTTEQVIQKTTTTTTQAPMDQERKTTTTTTEIQ